MNNLATLGLQDTGWRQTKPKLKSWPKRTPPKAGVLEEISWDPSSVISFLEVWHLPECLDVPGYIVSYIWLLYIFSIYINIYLSLILSVWNCNWGILGQLISDTINRQVLL
jgi:hypothetical protein